MQIFSKFLLRNIRVDRATSIQAQLEGPKPAAKGKGKRFSKHNTKGRCFRVAQEDSVPHCEGNLLRIFTQTNYGHEWLHGVVLSASPPNGLREYTSLKVWWVPALYEHYLDIIVVTVDNADYDICNAFVWVVQRFFMQDSDQEALRDLRALFGSNDQSTIKIKGC
ncbi:uncharacterized protein LAESUDRAFT_711822 [Laetiporus sulphureus 93-53]|uniref:Uncharacterized protein n=1 Tax=Laetiporus sulphureus 93-53 TaxID=1314785 RepID=A0A165G8I1_9APHY|nr:uncharacterized protein LAESUDRAFT_711822 [Laetiporus sulphureus 93-53]KZT09977.1 hypothetical protein LAESUDRAFT_711822 [Laetiporus sulphureus 93-53]